MKFSLRLNNDLPVSTYVQLAQAAEAAGFGQFWVSDDLFLRSAPVILTAVACVTERIARIRHHADRHEYTQAGNLISDDLLDRFAFSGTPADIIRQAKSLFAAETRRIEFGTPHGLNAQIGVDLLGSQVISALKTYRV